MKKLIALLMALAIVVSLCACGSSSNGSTDTNDTESESSVPETSNEDTGSQQPEETDTETQQPEEAQEPAGMQEGDKGDGPADIDASLVTFTVPEGYSYEAYSYYIDDDDSLFGNLQFDICETSGYNTLVQVVATTQYYVHSQDEAVQKVIELCNLDTYEKGEATIGDEVTYGDITYTRIDVTTEWSDNTFYVAYAENGNSGDVGLVVKFVVDNNMIDSDDPLINAVLESLVVVTK